MKNIIIVFLVILMGASTVRIYAHEHHHNDSLKVTTSDSLMNIEMAENQQMEAVNAFPNYHPLIVHFPIVLLIMALLFQFLSFFFFKKEFSWASLILLALGVLATWLSSNPFHAMPGVLSGKAKEIFDTHEKMAAFTWWFALAALLVKIVSHFFLKRKLITEVAVAILLISSAITVSIAGHHGAMLVYMEGIGPMGKYLDEYKLPQNLSDNTSDNMTKAENNNEENHYVGEIGKGPHGGTIEEAEPFHIEILADGKDLIFYLLDGDAKPVDMKNVKGNITIQYVDRSSNKIDLMEMDGKQTAMQANNGIRFIVFS